MGNCYLEDDDSEDGFQDYQQMISIMANHYRQRGITFREFRNFLTNTKEMLSRKKYQKGVFRCRKYILRGEAQAAAESRNVDLLLFYIEKAYDEEKAAISYRGYCRSITRNIAIILEYLGDLYLQIRVWHEAIKIYEAALEVLNRLIKTYPKYTKALVLRDRIQGKIRIVLN